LTQFGRALSLVAVGAFWLQALAFHVVSAHAATGEMLEPAVAMTATTHSHGLVAHVHSHGSGVAGHVHDPLEPVDGDNLGVADGPSWTLFSPSQTIVPDADALCPPDAKSVAVLASSETADGIHLPGLIKPPSTPNIA
jgi:hypothetical protein